MTIHKQNQRTTDSTNPVETRMDMQPRSLPTRRYTSMRCYITNSYIGKSVHLLLRQTTYMPSSFVARTTKINLHSPFRIHVVSVVLFTAGLHMKPWQIPLFNFALFLFQLLTPHGQSHIIPPLFAQFRLYAVFAKLHIFVPTYSTMFLLFPFDNNVKQILSEKSVPSINKIKHNCILLIEPTK